MTLMTPQTLLQKSPYTIVGRRVQLYQLKLNEIRLKTTINSVSFFMINTEF